VFDKEVAAEAGRATLASLLLLPHGWQAAVQPQSPSSWLGSYVTAVLRVRTCFGDAAAAAPAASVAVFCRSIMLHDARAMCHYGHMGFLSRVGQQVSSSAFGIVAVATRDSVVSWQWLQLPVAARSYIP
jgi:hypothetical protein